VIHGHCDPRFAPIREMFEANLAAGDDHGAALAVTVDGVTVVDIWGGYRDEGRNQPWAADTLVLIMSVTKGLTGLCGNMCIERGLLDPEAPVARYWPEFAAAGKDAVPVRYLFDHRAGLPDLPGFDRNAVGDWDAVCAALAAQPPAWEPGTAHAYHSLTYGWLVGELIRRVTGKRPSQFLRDEVCRPLGVEAWIGAPPEIDDRIADVMPDLGPLRMDRRAEVPASNGFSNARSLARIFGALACGGELDRVHLLDPATIDAATSDAVTGSWYGGEPAPVLAKIRFARGFELSSDMTYMGPNPRAFGHSGAGGSMAWADPERRVSFAYTPNLFETDIDLLYRRSNELTRRLFECLDDVPPA
jgi:CubicO group peptidase (beta-lactamase class C family)